MKKNQITLKDQALEKMINRMAELLCQMLNSLELTYSSDNDNYVILNLEKINRNIVVKGESKADLFNKMDQLLSNYLLIDGYDDFWKILENK